jgi:hypothetical protein
MGGAVLAWHTGAATAAGMGPLALAGGVNTALAFALGADWPALPLLSTAMLIGFLGYGLSLVLFVLALRGLGTPRILSGHPPSAFTPVNRWLSEST